MDRYCRDCGIDITHMHHNRVRCEECQERMRYRRSHAYIDKKQEERALSAPRCLTDLGTTDFKPHRNKNFNKELEEIEEEMVKLGLRK